MNLAMVYVDLETGGLDRERHPIIQLAAVATDAAGEIVAEFEAKVAFDVAAADPTALAMNHYTAEAWVGAKPEAEVLTAWSEWLRPLSTVEKVSKKGNAYRVAQLGGHNAGAFDVLFLQAAYRRHGLFFPADYHVFDTMAAAQIVSMVTGRKFKTFKLVDLCAEFGIEIGQAHSALADVRASARLGKALLALLSPA